jgi:DNA-directed RNA polymerase subunit E'/Rpb7
MVHYISQYQLKFQNFGNLHTMNLDANNRWISLGENLPWDNLISIYAKYFADFGRSSINPRIVIGSLIIKHKMNLSDEQTVMIIQENPYMQFFLGLDEFSPAPLFSPTIFVEWRKKFGNKAFNDFSDVLLRITYPEKFINKKGDNAANKGKLKLDATVADQNITYPNDLGLLNSAREKTEKIIDILYEHVRDEMPIKPRTYRKVARKKYLAESKKRQNNPKTLRSCIRYQLNSLDRNILSINEMLDKVEVNPLSHNQMKDFWVIQTLNTQQRKMYDEKSNRCADRIVSISQPHVRPIVRGKTGKKVEFGSKLGLVHMDGFVKAETLSWDAYNESADLIPHAEAYKALYGYYPELIQVDKIYGTNKNRRWCKEKKIRMTVAQKGKTKEHSVYEKRKSKKEFNERNQIEGKIGQAKQGYGLNQIKAKLSDTSNTWIGIVLFITNLVKFAEIHGFRF